MSNRPGQGRPVKPSTMRDRNDQDAYLQTPAKLPPAPRNFSPEERQAWWREGVVLIQARLITQADLTALAIYCRALVTYEAAHEQLKHEGDVIWTPSGSVKPNPLHAIVAQYSAQVERLARELGLTPAGRTKLPKRKGEGGPRPAATPPRPTPGSDPRLRAVK